MTHLSKTCDHGVDVYDFERTVCCIIVEQKKLSEL